ncbi:MAG TPA: hypothetical protein VHA10_00140 [Hypericibacter adhaerens]|nr:hypothetical protein [Hypericibacter adhaerens]HWA41589.1 hypothetical protein [Hypericibacter adhaerens]
MLGGCVVSPAPPGYGVVVAPRPYYYHPYYGYRYYGGGYYGHGWGRW